MKKQNGVSLIGLLIVGALVIGVAIVGMKIVPSVIEYFTLQKNIKKIASSSPPGTSVAEIRKAYSAAATIDETSSIGAEDLDVSKDGNEVVISFAYSKKIPLAGNVSLIIDYAGSSASNKPAVAD